MTIRPRVRKAIIIGITVTVAGAIFFLAFPNTTNYVFLPGMMIVYVLSGGVHGYSSGVYLPPLPLWYALGGFIDALIYSLLAFVTLNWLRRSE
jgi:hypothetical protein